MDNNRSALNKAKTILTKLLSHTPLEGILELNITKAEFEFMAASSHDSENFAVLIGIKTLNMFNEATIAVLLGHELGHLVKKVDSDGKGQTSSDIYGLELALKAGYNPKDMREYERELRKLAKLPNTEQNPLERIANVKRWIDNHTSVKKTVDNSYAMV